MMLLKTVGLLMIVTFFTLLGFAAARRLEERTSALKALRLGMNTLGEYIRYGEYELSAVLPSCFGNCDFLKICGAAVSVNDSALNKGDVKVTEEFFSRLGESCADAECRRIEMYEALIDDKIREAVSAVSSKSKLLRTGGFCIGLAVGIFII